jgi:hypothetical protein
MLVSRRELSEHVISIFDEIRNLDHAWQFIISLSPGLEALASRCKGQTVIDVTWKNPSAIDIGDEGATISKGLYINKTAFSLLCADV